MSDTVLDHELVRAYLRALDAACAGLPGPQARELHEQLAAHLDDALPADATDDSVRDVLSRLGMPRLLAAEAAGADRLTVLRKLGNRARRVRWWAWAAVGLLVPALGTGAGFLVSMNSAAPLYSVSAGWLYPVDQALGVNTRADSVVQTTVPVRFGQLFHAPVRRLLRAGVSPAWGMQVAFVRWLVGVGDDVVLVGVHRLAAATGAGAGVWARARIRCLSLRLGA